MNGNDLVTFIVLAIVVVLAVVVVVSVVVIVVVVLTVLVVRAGRARLDVNLVVVVLA